MDMCFACIAAVLTNQSGWGLESLDHTNIKKLLCAMHGIHAFDGNVWFANYLHCIKR